MWQPVEVSEAWLKARTGKLDILSPSWFAYRKTLGPNGLGTGPKSFMERLKRQHAIETGVIERLYDLTQGVTETLIEEGFREELISYGESSIPAGQLIEVLNDHLDAVDMVFDFIKEERPLGKNFLHELHLIVTRHQGQVEVIDSLGKRSLRDLRKGQFKEHPNNPRRIDGTTFQYCSPEQVESQITQMLDLYAGLEQSKTHPAIIAAWLHHAFATIHPYQDGNGRVGRLLTTLVLIRHGLFPFTVLRQEKPKYIDALEAADRSEVQPFVDLVVEGQHNQIERALSFMSADEDVDLTIAAKELVSVLANKESRIVEVNNGWVFFRREALKAIVIEATRKVGFELHSGGLKNDLRFQDLEYNSENKSYLKEIELMSNKYNYDADIRRTRSGINLMLFVDKVEEGKSHLDSVAAIVVVLHSNQNPHILHLGGFYNYWDKKGEIGSQSIILKKPLTISIDADVKIAELEIFNYVKQIYLKGITEIKNKLT